tara:strand:+ start:422 stop:574 length:153 start_codon:yes stop_codon:yes gene_type:complete
MNIEDLIPILHQSPTTVLAIMVWLQVREITAKMDTMVEKLARIDARQSEA